MKEKTYRKIGKTLIFLSMIMLMMLLIFSTFISTWITANQISDPETIMSVKSKLDRTYNYTELLAWEHNHLNFTSSYFERSTDPIKILEDGKGRCSEFAILTLLCVSLKGMIVE
jgi:hypothetical protein